jgi:GxxExxY protein
METTERTENTEGVFADLTRQVIGCAIEVHRILGPGLLESTYEQCLAHELKLTGVEFMVQPPLPVLYKGVLLDCGYRIDILVDECLVVELKAVEHLTAVHEAQILTYMKLAEAPVGLLLNFNAKLLKQGIKRFAL